MTTSRLLAKLEDFRLLPVFVLVSMAIGIAIGKALSISDFELTPPIDALKSIAGGTFELSRPERPQPGRAHRPVPDDVPGDDQRAPRRGRVGLPLAAPAGRRAPLQLPRRAVPHAPAREPLRRATRSCTPGLVLYGLAPCIAMVIVFTYLAKGNVPMALVFVAINSVAQMLLIPVYARLLIGDVDFDVLVVGESVLLYLGLPLLAGVLTRMVVVRRGGEAAMERLKPGLNALSILGLLFTLIVMFSLKGDLILERPGIVVEMAIPMTIFFAAMFFVVLVIGSRLRFSYEDGVAVAFNTTGRDFEIAIAIAITAFSPTVALATVVGPLIEVPVMLFLVWAAMRLRPRLFPGQAGGAPQEVRTASELSPEGAAR